MKQIIVHLTDGSMAISEQMDDDAAHAEFERILAEEPTKGSADDIIRVGKTAAFRAADFKRIEISEPPSSAY